MSLERKTLKCTDVFLKYLTDLANEVKDDSEWPVFVCVTDDVTALLTCGSSQLQPFFAVLMQHPASPTLPQFLTPVSPLPIIILTDNRIVKITDFDISKEGDLGSDLVKFAISLVIRNVTPGSAESLELMNALQDCADKTVLTTPYLSLLIETKWEYFYIVTLSFTLLYAVMLISLVMVLFETWKPVPLGYVFVGLNLYLMAYEFAQMLVTGCSYWSDPWNSVDLIRGLLCLFWGILVITDQETTVLEVDFSKYIRLVLVLMCFLRGFTYFRSFRMTRLFVYLTLAVVKEMYSFLIIMGYTVFAFGVCSATLVPRTSLSDSWTTAFVLILGDFDSSDFSFVQWTIFSCAALINVIIMLNLLVSILGDAYEKTQMSVRENDLYMQLTLLTEYESLLFWRRDAGKRQVMMSCELDEVTEVTEEWAGLAVEMKAAFKENSLEVVRKMQSLKEQMKEQEKTIETIGKKVERVEGRMMAMDGKLEAILGLLSSRS